MLHVRWLVLVTIAVGCGSGSTGPGTPLDGPDAGLREGDILFQTSRSRQSDAIALATGSPWTHVGLLFRAGDAWQVLEAVGPVRTIPLEQWIAQGQGGRYVVKRLASDRGTLDAGVLKAMRAVGKRYLGLPYDMHFRWDDERIYCSELVWKIYAEGAGVELCEARPLHAFALEHERVAATMRERYGTAPPLDEPVVAPSTLFDCPKLVTVRDAR
jgi:hypothetical protein